MEILVLRPGRTNQRVDYSSGVKEVVKKKGKKLLPFWGGGSLTRGGTEILT